MSTSTGGEDVEFVCVSGLGWCIPKALNLCQRSLVAKSLFKRPYAKLRGVDSPHYERGRHCEGGHHCERREAIHDCRTAGPATICRGRFGKKSCQDHSGIAWAGWSDVARGNWRNKTFCPAAWGLLHFLLCYPVDALWCSDLKSNARCSRCRSGSSGRVRPVSF